MQLGLLKLTVGFLAMMNVVVVVVVGVGVGVGVGGVVVGLIISHSDTMFLLYSHFAATMASR